MNKTNPRADDYYTLKAKKEGYPARSVYKLMEIQKKFRVFGKGASVLDIGAAPGSWSLYALKEVGEKGFVTAVDLLNIEINYKCENFFFIQGDAFCEENFIKLKARGLYNAVLSDAAPSTTGNRGVDTEKSFAIAECVIALSENLLAHNGNIVIKIFQGGGEKKIVEKLKKLFEAVKIFKPDAVRKNSFEIYLIGKGRRFAAQASN